jgi:hypothetical protein
LRFRVSAKVQADAVAKQPFELTVDDLRIGVTADPRGLVTGIWFDLPVPDFESWMPSIVQGDGTTSNPHQISFNNPPQADRLLSVMQYVESLGSFWLGIRRIWWDEAKWEWIAESDVEKGRAPVLSVGKRLTYQRQPIPFRANALRQLILAQEKKEWLVIPMSFLREGTNHYEAHRYINAFYDFYFFLEDLFGHGKTQNRHVLREFQSSAELKTATACAYKVCAEDSRKVKALSDLMAVVGGDTSDKGLLKFLVMMRGELHHFSRRSSRPKGHPLNQHQFQPLAFFAMAICINVLPSLITGDRPDPASPREVA